jgi:D-hydroxyproline dehydrogenase subunit beta
MAVRGVRDVIVVGAGIAGCTVAYELARRGLDVSLFDQGGIAGAASGRNQGLLLNDVDSDSVEMMRGSLEVYRELDGGPVPFGLRQQPYLLIATTPEQLRLTEKRVLAMREAGLRCDLLSEQALREGLPQVRSGIAGAFLLHDCWAVSAGAATRAFAEAARASGARIRTHTRVAQLSVRSGRVEGVLSDDGQLAADAVVLAAGPWLSALLPGVPVSVGRGWLLRTAPLGIRLPWVVLDMSWPDLEELGRAARPPRLAEVAAGGYDLPAAATVSMVPQPAGEALLGTSLAPSLLEPVEGVDMPRRIAQRSLDLLPGLAEVSITAGWYGLRPMTPDGLPLVGRASVEGIYLHAGHGSIGMQSGPLTARRLVDGMLGGGMPERMSPARFASKDG